MRLVVTDKRNALTPTEEKKRKKTETFEDLELEREERNSDTQRKNE